MFRVYEEKERRVQNTLKNYNKFVFFCGLFYILFNFIIRRHDTNFQFLS